MGTFLEIEDVFDKVNFTNIQRAAQRIPSSILNWIMTMLGDPRIILEEPSGDIRAIVREACPQGEV